MCGICGVVSGDPRQLEPLGAMTESLAHRGPDGGGIVLAGASPLASVGLGHRRLAVIDLATGEQPLESADGAVVVSFNGEIYNFRALRGELAALGRAFRTASDTEVIAQAIAQWGDAALPRLDGMFAFAAWDGRRGQLLLARDRLGKKPLYYSHLPSGGLAFASEIKALLRHPAVDAALDDAALPAYLCYGHVPAPATWYRAIRQLPPGHALSWQVGGAVEWRWWEPAAAAGERADIAPAAAAKEARRLIRAAVERRLVSDVPLGAFLSGGIDSSVIVAELRALGVAPIKTFSIGFAGDRWYDETAYARLVARRFGTDHHEFIVEPDAVALIETLVDHYDEPFADSAALPTYLLSQMTRGHVTVALSGDGGDELFAGYQRFGAGLWARRYGRLPAALRRPFEAGARMLGRHGAADAPLPRLARVAAKLALPPDEGFPRWLMLWTPDEIAAMIAAGPKLVSPDPAERFRRLTDGIGDPLAALLAYNLSTYLADDLLPKADRMSMAHGLEVRSPLLDTALLEWSLRLPGDLHWHPLGRGKRLLRRAYRGVLPDAILDRPKHGFGVPLDAWFRRDLRPLVEDTLLAPGALLGRWLDRRPLLALWQDHLAGRRNAGHHLWALLTLEVWLRRQRPGSPE